MTFNPTDSSMYLLRDSEPNEAQVVERSHHRLSYRVNILYERELLRVYISPKLTPFTLSTAVRAVLNAAIFSRILHVCSQEAARINQPGMKLP